MNGKWTHENFLEYHSKNPEIYSTFESYALRAARRRDRYSAKAIFHVIRWDTMVSGGEGEYKIDDGWISHYARMFMDRNPEHEGFFSTRVRSSSYHK